MSVTLYPGGDNPVTPNLGLALWDMSLTMAENFEILDSSVAAGSLKVNGTTVTAPNLVNSATATLSVVGSNISIATTGVPGGSNGDIQYNNHGAFGGSSATIDAAGNFIDLTGTIAQGDLSTLPIYINTFSFPGINTFSGTIPAGYGGARGGGALLTTNAYCSDPSTFVIGYACCALGAQAYGHLTRAALVSGCSGGVANGFVIDTYAEDNTVTNATLYGGTLQVFSAGGSTVLATGLLINVNAGGAIPTGVALARGIEITTVQADPSTGVAAGLYIDFEGSSGQGIKGATTYAIRSDTTAPTAFNGLVGWFNSGRTAIDTAFSRLAPNSLALGSGAQGDVTGELTLANLILSAPQTPASNAAGTTGQLAYGTSAGTSYIYVCIASGNWQRAALTAGY
jgi:hypothetical protein